MSGADFTIRAQRGDDRAQIEALLDEAFGPERRAKTAYRLREGSQVADGLAFVAEKNGRLAGTIEFWPLTIGGVFGLLLGPLAVANALKGAGVGIGLMRHGLERAAALSVDQGYQLVILVGDEPYYARAGFAKVPPGKLVLPGPVAPERLLYVELAPGALAAAKGEVAAAPG